MRLLTTKRLPLVLAIALGTGVLCCMAFFINAFNSMQLYSGDVLFKTSTMTSTAGTHDKLVIVAVDDASLSELGKISLWPRSYYARLVDILAQSRARLIVFDVLFSEISPDDAKLAASMKAAGNVVITVASKAGAVQSIIVDGTADRDVFLRPVPVLAESAVALGHADVLAGHDGTVRDLSLYVNNGNESMPSLSLAAVTKYLRRPSAVDYTSGDGIISIAGRSIPVSNDSDMIINYVAGRRDSEATLFKTVSFIEVFRGNVDPDLFNDKIVIIGSTASGLGDAFWTQLGAKLNGVEIHASAINTILAGDFVRTLPPAATVACIIILGLLCGLIVAYFHPLVASLFSLLLGLAYVVVVSACFERGLMLNPFYPSLSILG